MVKIGGRDSDFNAGGKGMAQILESIYYSQVKEWVKAERVTKKMLHNREGWEKMNMPPSICTSPTPPLIMTGPYLTRHKA